MTAVVTALLTTAVAAPATASGTAPSTAEPTRPVVTVDTPLRVEVDEHNMRHLITFTVDRPVDVVGAYLRMSNGEAFGPGQVSNKEYVLVPGTTSTYQLDIPWSKYKYPYWGSYYWSVSTQTLATETTPYIRTGQHIPVVIRLGSSQSINVTRTDGVTRVTGESRHLDVRAEHHDYRVWPGQKVTVERLDAAGGWTRVGTAVGDQRGRFTVKTLAPAGTQFRAVVSRTPDVWGSVSPTMGS
ncbi:hypothetical protein [Pseudokineococcus lusitanus]|nr:hypothetical protein [Pseudokineococcus lusitanus]